MQCINDKTCTFQDPAAWFVPFKKTLLPDAMQPMTKLVPSKTLLPDAMQPMIRHVPSKTLLPDAIQPMRRLIPSRTLLPDAVQPMTRLVPSQTLLLNAMQPMTRHVPSKTLLPDAMQTWEEHSTDGKPENKDRKTFFMLFIVSVNDGPINIVCREMITKFNLQDPCYLFEFFF